MSTTISIGRNIPNSGPMDTERWHKFTTELTRITRAFCNEIYFVGLGTGTYQGEEEESFTLIAQDVSYCDRERFEDSLHRLAGRYEQEALSFTSGRTQFLYA